TSVPRCLMVHHKALARGNGRHRRPTRRPSRPRTAQPHGVTVSQRSVVGKTTGVKATPPPADPTSSRGRSALLVVCLAVFVDMLGFGIILPALPFRAAQLGGAGVWV